MKKGIFAVLDLKAAAFGPPWQHDTPGSAQRQFLDWALKEGPIAEHPEDYTLHMLAYFDPTTGIVEPSTAGPVPLVNAQLLLAQNNGPTLVQEAKHG